MVGGGIYQRLHHQITGNLVFQIRTQRPRLESIRILNTTKRALPSLIRNPHGAPVLIWYGKRRDVAAFTIDVRTGRASTEPSAALAYYDRFPSLGRSGSIVDRRGMSPKPMGRVLR